MARSVRRRSRCRSPRRWSARSTAAPLPLAPDCTALILLAAGRSVRFGSGASKLDIPWQGMPLGLHAAATLAALPFARRIAVTGPTTIDYAAHGFTVIPNPAPQDGMGGSLALGVAAAGSVDAVLIALADMPCITLAHVHALLAAAEDRESVVASTDGAPSPPALIGAAHLSALASATGDRGARDLIRGATLVTAPPGTLVDIDTPADLDALTRGGARRSG